GRTQVDIARLESIEPGRYRLRMAGLAADVASSDSFLVISRPIEKWKMVAAILAIIASAALTLGGLIASLATLVKFQSGWLQPVGQACAAPSGARGRRVRSLRR